MPIYDYLCEKCNERKELVRLMNSTNPLCCGQAMVKLLTTPATIIIKGPGGNSARRKWAENWTSDSPKFSTGSLHGERY